MSTDTFDERAATWDDDPAKVERARVVASAIADALPLDRSMRVLEYGAGTGLVSQALADDVGPLTLADTSEGMRRVIGDKIAAGAIADARLWDLDLASGKVPDEGFDLVVTVMALHHIADLGPVLSAFAALTAGGGHLAVVDLDAEDGSFHGEGFEGHHGFDRSALESLLHRHGFADVAFRTCHRMTRGDRTYSLFLATAHQPDRR